MPALPPAADTAQPQRRALMLAAAGLAVAPTWAVAQAAAAAPAMPIFDAHLHYSHDAWERLPPAQAVALLREAGLKKAMVSSSSDEGTQKLFAIAPDLVEPVLLDDAEMDEVLERFRNYGQR
jgi:hypothetical protein